MSFKRPKFYRHIDFAASAAVNFSGGRATSLSAVECYDVEEVSGSRLHWGAHLRPHHFEFSEGSTVRLRMEGRRDVVCQAISIYGSGCFLESDSASPVDFENGAIIVKAGERYKLFTFEEFRSRFVLNNGAAIESIYQIDYQTPKK